MIVFADGSRSIARAAARAPATLLAALPPEFVARKGSYWRLGHNLLQLSRHTREHIGQIRAAIESARHK